MKSLKHAILMFLDLLVFSLSHRKAGSLYLGHNSTNVQDFGVKRLGARLQSKRALLRWNQV